MVLVFHHIGDAAASVWSQRSFNFWWEHSQQGPTGVEEAQVYNKSKKTRQPFGEFFESHKVGSATVWGALFTTPVKFRLATNKWLPHGGMYTFWSLARIHNQLVLSSMEGNAKKWARRAQQHWTDHFGRQLRCTNSQWFVRRGSFMGIEDVHGTRKFGDIDVWGPRADIGV